ncbi:branched-chain amino acid ABC transporter permease [Diaphorobacter sp. HDW4A]|uniref:branched-chain amino acid ABC transporter permease n=1 Tax=Diaphorobacter sp. HDW4A TaxID=2714924 RepID=UPI001407CD77|nr:branched-chain amino acid ABC transporter permease [Diaphorobacter sp. HDW4A]QIL79302.1 branched-chain amino acid ABC transporter permease [Diaphorobacter sp. HDW4A]
MLPVIWQGVVTGCLYSLGALGLVMVFKSSGMVNFAHGALAGLGAFLVYDLHSGSANWPWPLAVLAAVVASVVIAALTYASVAGLLKKSHTTATIGTLGVGLIAQGLILWKFGSNIVRLDLPLPAFTMDVLGMKITAYDLAVILSTLLVVAFLFSVIDYTRLGIGFRAVATDPFAALVSGLSITRVHLFSWVVSSILGVVAALLIVPTTFLSSTTVTTFMLQAFAAAVIGGFDSLPGSAIGGILVGVACNLFSFYVAPELLNAFLLVFILASLSVFPGGLLSKRMGSRV